MPAECRQLQRGLRIVWLQAPHTNNDLIEDRQYKPKTSLVACNQTAQAPNDKKV